MLEEKHLEIEKLDWVPIPPGLKDGLSDQTIPKRKLKNWELVLQSRQIPCRSEKLDHKWQLLVPTDQYQIACQELIQQYETENRNWPPPPSSRTKTARKYRSNHLDIHSAGDFSQYNSATNQPVWSSPGQLG